MMTKHTSDVTIAALTEWMLAHQDDTGCREAADTLGGLGAVSNLIGMLDGSITARCAIEIADALATHGGMRVITDMMRLHGEFGAVAGILGMAIRRIEEERDCTCSMCGDPLDTDDDRDDHDNDDDDYGGGLVGSGTGGRVRPVSPPDHRQPDSRN